MSAADPKYTFVPWGYSLRYTLSARVNHICIAVSQVLLTRYRLHHQNRAYPQVLLSRPLHLQVNLLWLRRPLQLHPPQHHRLTRVRIQPHTRLYTRRGDPITQLYGRTHPHLRTGPAESPQLSRLPTRLRCPNLLVRVTLCPRAPATRPARTRRPHPRHTAPPVARTRPTRARQHSHTTHPQCSRMISICN